MTDPTQRQHLARVTEAIGRTIVAYHAEALQTPTQEFTMAHLQRYVAIRHASAPDSPSRILRALRQRGLIDYVVVDRGASLYRALPLEDRA